MACCKPGQGCGDGKLVDKKLAASVCVKCGSTPPSENELFRNRLCAACFEFKLVKAFLQKPAPARVLVWSQSAKDFHTLWHPLIKSRTQLNVVGVVCDTRNGDDNDRVMNVLPLEHRLIDPQFDYPITSTPQPATLVPAPLRPAATDLQDCGSQDDCKICLDSFGPIYIIEEEIEREIEECGSTPCASQEWGADASSQIARRLASMDERVAFANMTIYSLGKKLGAVVLRLHCLEVLAAEALTDAFAGSTYRPKEMFNDVEVRAVLADVTRAEMNRLALHRDRLGAPTQIPTNSIGKSDHPLLLADPAWASGTDKSHVAVLERFVQCLSISEPAALRNVCSLQQKLQKNTSRQSCVPCAVCSRLFHTSHEPEWLPEDDLAPLKGEASVNGDLCVRCQSISADRAALLRNVLATKSQVVRGPLCM